MTFARGWAVHRYESVASTMDEAASLARTGAPEGTVVISAEQTAGRGRSGRVWRAPKGSGVFCTLILRPPVSPDRLSTLPLVAGVAVAEAIEAVSGLPAQVKWPNDVWVGTDPERRKVAGVLTTSSLAGGAVAFVLVGIGINVSADANALPPGATSLQAASGRPLDPDTVFFTLLDRFDLAYAAYLTADGRPSLAAWHARAALLGERVTIVEAGRELTGTFLGVDADGALLLATPGSTPLRIVSGDLTRGPRLTV
jgi:BirA family biotin operon repressor/biotin-[acetyl-CoA-carboxylase] ligase